MADKLETAPDFALPETSGTQVSLQSLSGTAFVLFFYPRDDTSGCTKEAVAFSALLPDFEALGVKVFGVSKDTLAKHAKFIAKHELTVPLLSDAESDACEAFGVWQEKKMYGKSHMGIVRSTFLIGADGSVLNEWRKVKVPGHAEAVLDAAREALG